VLKAVNRIWLQLVRIYTCNSTWQLIKFVYDVRISSSSNAENTRQYSKDLTELNAREKNEASKTIAK
jgi:hypothetical protein